MAKRKRRRAVVKHNPPKRHVRRRRSTRHNPPFRMGGIVKQVTEGAVDGALGVAGMGLVRVIRDKTGFAGGTIAGSAVEAAASIGLGIVARKALGPSAARAVIQGGFMAPMISLVRSAGVPVLSSALGDDGDLGEFVSGYPMLGDPSTEDVGGYPALSGYGDGPPYVGQGSAGSSMFGDDEMSDYDVMASDY